MKRTRNSVLVIALAVGIGVAVACNPASGAEVSWYEAQLQGGDFQARRAAAQSVKPR